MINRFKLGHITSPPPPVPPFLCLPYPLFALGSLPLDAGDLSTLRTSPPPIRDRRTICPQKRTPQRPPSPLRWMSGRVSSPDWSEPLGMRTRASAVAGTPPRVARRCRLQPLNGGGAASSPTIGGTLTPRPSMGKVPGGREGGLSLSFGTGLFANFSR